MEDKRKIPIIEWEDLDKRKFYVFGVFMTMAIRVSVYPFTLIRTRLQVQKGKCLYSGTFDAFAKILRAEGISGLYRGFLVNTFTLISGQCYVTTYELTRKYVAQYSNSNMVKSVIAGGSASLVAQSITVPIDIVSQHLMVQGQAMGRFQGPPREAAGAGTCPPVVCRTKDIMVQIFHLDGLRGFYRGYAASLLTYIPNSALWWPFYHLYTVVPCDPQLLPSPAGPGCRWPSGSCYFLYPHQPDGCHPGSSTGGGRSLNAANLQAAAAGRGCLGPEQGPVRSGLVLHPVRSLHRRGLRESEEVEPAA
ncbi:solute carrier family 25 member 44-like isoform X2 [Cetorhinus maximus]